jgi:hypothetical protein
MSERNSQLIQRQARSKLVSLRRTSATTIAAIFLFSACVYGPKAERKSPLNYLNGENYESSPQGPDKMVVVMAKRKDRTTRLRGRVVRKEGLVEVPVKQARVTLSNAEKATVAEARTDLNGEFALAGVIPNGRYRIAAESEWRSGTKADGIKEERMLMTQTIDVNAYEIDNIIIRLLSGINERSSFEDFEKKLEEIDRKDGHGAEQ